ncbi:MAG TPA: divalent-cation tolerance protein CutA [Candidatus Competibacteraceae bacterium]|nr:divalent-cation tolerance protein CutA [Candidatus Competibacteraceae bacterium]HRY14572.1 divalent-cation tolerance protein CutA [Candidatus Competibacteraceae bacterium]
MTWHHDFKGETFMDNQPLVVYCTCPDQTVAEQIAETTVSERLAACVNLAPGLTSIYRWKGGVQRDSEWLLIIKTRGKVYPLLEARIRELHPYDTPEIIALPIQTGSAAYLDWITDNTGAPL